jgi:Yip1 domain
MQPSRDALNAEHDTSMGGSISPKPNHLFLRQGSYSMDFAKLIERAKNICLSPSTEWPKIAGESATTQSLFTGYAMILAAIPAICGFIGMTVIGMSMPIVGTVRTGVAAGLVQLIVGYVLGLVAVYILSIIINALAPTFDGQKDPINALKLAVYAYTPSWLAGILMLVPLLGMLVILAGLYGIYLLYLGLPHLMKNPAEKSVGYTALIVVCAIVLGIVMSVIIGAIAGTGAMMGGLR